MQNEPHFVFHWTMRFISKGQLKNSSLYQFVLIVAVDVQLLDVEFYS